jgi:YD repeat-containing protein
MNRFLFLIFILLLPLMDAGAKISTDNGNFYLVISDVNEDGHFELLRYYNSVGYNESGMFGYGWGSTFESRITSVGGIVAVEETPGGGKSFYLPKDKGEVAGAVNMVMSAVIKEPEKHDKVYLDKLKKSLSEDSILLLEFAKKYGIKSKPAAGAVFTSRERPGEYVKKTPTGYVRFRNSGDKDEYDNEGKLVRLTYASGEAFRFAYNTSGRLTELKDLKGRGMKFTFNENKLVTKIALNNGKTCEYRYSDRGDLLSSRDENGLVFTYEYDNYHNMTLLDQPPERRGETPPRTIVKYDIAKDKVVYAKSPEGLETFYEYFTDEGDYYHKTKVIKKFNNAVDAEQYETWERPRPDGSKYVYKMKETRGKDVKTAVYTQCCGTPLMLDYNGKVSRFEYDEKGRLKKKVFPDGRILDVRYGPKGFVDKIINNGEPYIFKYDSAGRIVFAGMRKIKFKVDYDKQGRVRIIKDNLNRSFGFVYDTEGRISRLTSKKGDISMKYDSSGNLEIKDDGEDKLWEIRRAYQQYIEIMAVIALLDERY